MNGLRGEGNTGRAQVLEENLTPDVRLVFCLYLFIPNTKDKIHLTCLWTFELLTEFLTLNQ